MYEYLVTANEMRAFDSLTINSVGIPGIVLMENAGRSTFHALQKHFSSRLEGSKVSVIAGSGNNGGDGFVIARYLINQRAKVKTYLLAPKSKAKGDALINLNVLLAMHGDIEELESLDSITEAGHKWRESELIIDAILGTGLQSDVRSPFREAISIVNECAGFKVAV
ncbi:MAG: NAD(P)H-hydrate epimerase, partial [Desulfomonilaceae bacterium]